MILPVRSHNLNRTESEECVALADICKKLLPQSSAPRWECKDTRSFPTTAFLTFISSELTKMHCLQEVGESIPEIQWKIDEFFFTNDNSVRDLIELESDCGLISTYLSSLFFYTNACWCNKDHKSRRNWMQNSKWKIFRHQQNDDVLPAYQMQNWHQSLLYCSY